MEKRWKRRRGRDLPQSTQKSVAEDIPLSYEKCEFNSQVRSFISQVASLTDRHQGAQSPR